MKNRTKKDSDKIRIFNINQNLQIHFNVKWFNSDSIQYGLSLGVYCSIIHTYPTPPIYVLHSLQGQFIGFQDFTLLLNSKRVSHSCISDGSVFQIYGPKYEMLSKPFRTVSFLGILKKEFESQVIIVRFL